MGGLALRSLRHRGSAFLATFTAILLGTALIGAFAALGETAVRNAAGTDRETLLTMAAVVGSWGALIALFSVASTVGITVAQRAVEVGLLRTIGATPRQVRRLVRAETLVVAVVATLLGSLLAWPAGRALLEVFTSGDLVSPGIEYAGGPASLGLTAAVLVVVCLLAASLAGRRATRAAPSVEPAETAAGAARLPRWRVVVGLVLIAYGIAGAVVTITVTRHADDPYLAMSTSGYCSILTGVGLAVLAPALLRGGAALSRPLLGSGSSAAAHLAAYNTSRRAHLLAGVLGPVIVLTSASVGTLMLVGIDERSITAETPETDLINLLNNVVVGMLVLFAAITVVNAFQAGISHRRTELQRLWLLGASPTQVERSVVAEAGIVAAVGVTLGLVASLTSIVPFAIARDEGLVPDGQLWLPPLVAAGCALLTLAAARAAARRTLATALRTAPAR